MSCRNIFLFPDFRIKVGDFGGALLQGHDFKYDQCYEGRYQLPLRGRSSFHDLDMMKQELLALGVAIYEIITWRRRSTSLERNLEKSTRSTHGRSSHHSIPITPLEM